MSFPITYNNEQNMIQNQTHKISQTKNRHDNSHQLR